ncbi:MAG: glycoside hydrolase family 3 N-terminal domain-containing protein, partial [Bacteroidales bacterium]|nr:glycoside hydrolase family 3 N-terminal domain-containing protein [Bacteroidales bacterium]
IVLILVVLLMILSSGCEKKNDIDKMISKMSLKDKVTQMIMPSLRFKTYEYGLDENGNQALNSEDLEVLDEKFTALLEEYKFGGVILFSENLHSSTTSYEFIKQIKEAHGKDEIPLLIAVDQEGGNSL